MLAFFGVTLHKTVNRFFRAAKSCMHVGMKTYLDCECNTQGSVSLVGAAFLPVYKTLVGSRP